MPSSVPESSLVSSRWAWLLASTVPFSGGRQTGVLRLRAPGGSGLFSKRLCSGSSACWDTESLVAAGEEWNRVLVRTTSPRRPCARIGPVVVRGDCAGTCSSQGPFSSVLRRWEGMN